MHGFSLDAFISVAMVEIAQVCGFHFQDIGNIEVNFSVLGWFNFCENVRLASCK